MSAWVVFAYAWVGFDTYKGGVYTHEYYEGEKVNFFALVYIADFF